MRSGSGGGHDGLVGRLKAGLEAGFGPAGVVDLPGGLRPCASILATLLPVLTPMLKRSACRADPASRRSAAGPTFLYLMAGAPMAGGL
jgi:hypothetical protein